MTPEQIGQGYQQILAIATTAAQLSSGLALILREQGLVADAHAEHFSKLSRHLGELFQDAGHDDLAADFGAIAARLLHPRKGPE